MTQLLVTATGEEHGLINKIGNSVPADDSFKHMSKENAAKAKELRKKDAELVKARYLNSRGPNERLEKPYCRYAGDPICFYRLIPGEVYELPRGFIDEIEQSPGLAVRSEVLDAQGVPTKREGKAEKIHTLVPVHF